MAADAGVSVTTEGAIVTEARTLVREAAARGVVLRLLGGIAVSVRCSPGGPPHREFADLDAITRRKTTRTLVAVLEERGYEPNQRFNALNSRDRLIFYGPEGKLDVFVESFAMCHRLDLADRLEIDPETITVSDLLLTKLQVVELTDKDLQDVVLLLDAQSEGLDVPYVADLLASDWGLWRTVTGNLVRIAERAPATGSRMQPLLSAIEAAPKSRRWRSRAMVGERKRWYELPEETG